MNFMSSVFIVFHARETSTGGEDLKLIGAFFSREKAQEIILTVSDQPGFCDLPDGFSTTEYEVDKVFWQEGFGGSDPV
jgi:hypothetical protein